jgi:hypothetical protein
LAETLARPPQRFRLDAVRVGSGFFAREFLAELERQALLYLIVARMNALLRRAVSGIH